jgi:RNA recognition motif-containing protein
MFTSAYLITEEGLGKRSLRVRCFVCEKEWFQTTERLLKTDNQHHLQNMTDDKIAEVRRSQQAITWQTRQSSRLDKVGVFVGNLPYTFDEVILDSNEISIVCYRQHDFFYLAKHLNILQKEITDLFGDYGLTGLSLVRDGDGQSKGFAFLEV